jgi:hypothetical protein
VLGWTAARRTFSYFGWEETKGDDWDLLWTGRGQYDFLRQAVRACSATAAFPTQVYADPELNDLVYQDTRQTPYSAFGSSIAVLLCLQGLRDEPSPGRRHNHCFPSGLLAGMARTCLCHLVIVRCVYDTWGDRFCPSLRVRLEFGCCVSVPQGIKRAWSSATTPWSTSSGGA